MRQTYLYALISFIIGVLIFLIIPHDFGISVIITLLFFGIGILLIISSILTDIIKKIKNYKEKLEKLIQQHKDNWDALAEGYEQLRGEALAARTDAVEGLTKEATTFYDYVVQLAFDGGIVPAEQRQRLKDLMARIVEILQDTIGIIDFWRKPIDVKKLRGNIDTEILLSNIPQLAERHERIAVEVIKLAEKRHEELTK